MLLTKEINMKWNSYNIKYYTNLGYIYTKINDIFIIKIKDLNINSHYLVDIECDICHKVKKMQYKAYIACINNNNIYACSSCRYHKIKLTNNQKYGVDNVSYLSDIKEKISINTKKIMSSTKKKRETTNLIKYGCKNIFQNRDIINKMIPKTKNTKLKKGLILSDDHFSDFQLYKKIVMNLTHKNKKLIYANWNGIDYYDGEYIKDNFKYDSRSSNYPTVDHKISIRYGYDNNISAEEISNIDNLCITKKKINTLKYIKTEYEFKNSYNKLNNIKSVK